MRLSARYCPPSEHACVYSHQSLSSRCRGPLGPPVPLRFMPPAGAPMQRALAQIVVLQQQLLLQLLLLLLLLPSGEQLTASALRRTQQQPPVASLSCLPEAPPSLLQPAALPGSTGRLLPPSAAVRAAATPPVQASTSGEGVSAAEGVHVYIVLASGGIGRRCGGLQPKQFQPLLWGTDAASISAAKLLSINSCNSSDTCSGSNTFILEGEERWESVWHGVEQVCMHLQEQQEQHKDEEEKHQQGERRSQQGLQNCAQTPAARRQRALEFLRIVRSQQQDQQQKTPRGVYVLVHDAARPCMPPTAAGAAVAAASAASRSSAVVCSAATDTVKLGTPKAGVYGHLPRGDTLLAQTPQVLRLDVLLQAFAELFALQHEQQQLQQTSPQHQKRLQEIDAILQGITDDVSLLQLLPNSAASAAAQARDSACAVVLSGDSRENLKLTTRGDIAAAAALLLQEADTPEALPWLRLLGLSHSSGNNDSSSDKGAESCRSCGG
ncbi:hypothetical protein cyc_06196 [Cyclospora cayetanensis]|uniref:2-C-methyl-D-erythritol 4-phosphate cytidylyltransferase n=1 Tax=Cyclospora cayetanensis TaxID=88456 RepID=A0A1D3CST7_9EIME|nr:hypothetical protein cyc_06196 [Cyclospora cayetanensis]